MQKRSRVAIATAAVLIASSGSACGGDDDGLSKSEYLRRGNAICAKINPTVPDLPNIKNQLAQLRDLPAPEGDEEDVERIFDAADEALRRAEEDPQSLAEGNPFERSIALAKDYGLTNCGP